MMTKRQGMNDRMASSGFPENPASPGKGQFIAGDSSPPAEEAEMGTTNMEDRQA